MENTPSFFSITPATVRYNKNLEPHAKLLYGEITALANMYGYCWASNKYFADLYEVDERTVRRWLESLKKEKLIKVELKKNGIEIDRKIWISPEIQKMFTKGQNCPPPPDKNVRYNNKDEYVEKEACGAFVKLSKDEKEKAIEMCGQKVFEEIVQEMNDYCEAHGKEYKNYAAAIRTWYRKRQKDPKNNKETTAEKSQKWANELKSKNPQAREFEILPHSVRFMGRGNVGDIYIDYKDLSFYNRVSHEFRKRGWKLE